MKLPLFAGWRRHDVMCLLAVCLSSLILTGCGGPARRSASSLSERDRTVLADYERIRLGLARDDASVARSGAVALQATLKTGHQDAASKRLLAQVQGLLDARALDLERQAFAGLSVTLLPLARGVDGYYIMTAPSGVGGDWIQRTTDVDNPYLGKIMHGVGTLQE